MQPLLTFRFNDGTEVRRVGYGAMRLTGQPGNFGPYAAWEDGKKVLRRALELGINLIDTARAYGPGWNERLVAEALHPYPQGLFIATKGGWLKSRRPNVIWTELPTVCDVIAKTVLKTCESIASTCTNFIGSIRMCRYGSPSWVWLDFRRKGKFGWSAFPISRWNSLKR